ncbi:MAG: leucine-rich repeat protein [Treponema sp.]|nr:leucine-rich repeat protein [Treponema sp.]
MKRLTLLLGCVFALGLFSCKTVVEEVPANDEDVCILVNGSETMTSLEAGQQYILRLSNSSSANWAVSNDSAATLSAKSGVSINLSAKSAGSVTVTATVNDKTYTCALQIIKKGGEIEVPPDNGEINAPNVSFTNLSAYKVLVCRDGLSAEITTVEAGDTKTVYVSPGSNEITFHFRYSYCIVDDNDNGTIWMDATDNGAYTYPVDSVDIAQGVVPINIPAPKNPQFNAAYLKVENQSTQPVSLYNGNTQQKLYSQEKYYIQPRHSGVYAIPPDAPFEGFSVGASPSFAIAVAPFDVVSGALYACVFSAGGLLTDVSEEIRLGEMWAENTDTNYTVRHFKQDTDRIGYTLTETESLTGIMGADTDAKAMIYTGFAANPFEQVPISADETTVIDIYYDRNEYTVTFYANNGTDDTQSQTFYYGIEEKLKDNMFSNSGYGFLGWATSETDNPVYNNKADFLIGSQDPTNITLYAIWFHGITVTDDTARSIDLSDITDEYTIKVTGNISQSTLQTLADKIKTAKTAINLDLSEATGITEISSIGGSTSSDSKSIFADCRLLNSVVLPETLEVIGSYAFTACNIKSVTIPAGVQTIGSRAFSCCYNLEAVEIDGAETLGDYAFYYCTSLKSVVLKNVTTIGYATFGDCKNLSSVTMEAVDSIGSYAFWDCKNLSSITIDAESIGFYAFDGCTFLTAVVIGKNVKSIDNTGKGCFNGCTQLTSVRFEDTEGWYYKSSYNYSYTLDVTNAATNASNFKYSSYKNLWYKE